MSESIYRVLEELPQKSITTRLLGALDYLVPGEWQNITNFEAMIRHVTGEDDQELVQRIGERAISLYADKSQGYQRAVKVFRLVDNTGTIAGFTSMVHLLGERFDLLSFLGTITPKADTAQAVDASVKFLAELTTFCLTNGFPGDSVGDFAQSLANYEKEDSMRFAAWVVFDCLIPLGPDFLSILLDKISGLSTEMLGENGRFARIAKYLPGSIDDQRELIRANLDASRGRIEDMVSSKGLSREGVLERVREYIDLSDKPLDVVAAALDMTTNYFEHTGIQSVSRRLISRAYGEI
jgi:hypothetical protein